VAPASWSFVIAPPFWAEWWFRGLVGLAAAGGVLAFFSARVRQLKREQEAQREFSRRLIAFQEKERERIGAELHDGLGQELLVVKNGLDRAAGVAGGHTDLAGSLHQLSEMVHATLREVRDISYDLHPHTLDRLGLRRAIESVAARFAAASDITITAEVEDVDGILSKEKEINLFRVAQECLNNVLRHSGARTARVTVRRLPAAVELTVEDDGKGFDAAGARPGDERGGFGLSGMRERARLLGGTWSVRTGSGAGTTITTTIPT
jgi:signal transduction histidine kinase